MARARNIKPGLYKNEDLAECSIWARYLFPGLWTLADREGRLEDRPKRIKAELLAFDTQDVEPLLRELAARSFIVRYQIEGVSYIQISKFSTHQTPHYSEKPSVIKPPPLQEKPAHIETPDSEKRPVIKRGPQPPDSLIHRLSDSPNPDSPTPDTGKKRSAARRAPVPETGATWAAYNGAYLNRYGVEPVRNAKVNGMLASFLARVPQNEAPSIAEFYVGHSKGLYVSSRHCVDLLLRDAEGLRTEWATGRKVTEAEARQADRTAATGQQVERLIAEQRRVA